VLSALVADVAAIFFSDPRYALSRNKRPRPLRR
jgi:hypothetical protein